MTNQPDAAVAARQREIAVEHLMFRTIAHVEAHNPGLVDALEASLEHLGDPAHDATKDDEAVRAIARKLIEALRRQG